MTPKDTLIMDKILRFEDNNWNNWSNYDDLKSTFLIELGINEDRYQIYINEISKFSDNTKTICHTYNPYDDDSYPKFDCDESTKKFIEEGGFAGYYKIQKPMHNLDEILNEFMDILAAYYPSGIRPVFDFFNNKSYDYLANAIIEKGTEAGLIEWSSTIMVLTTYGYEIIQKHGCYLNSIRVKKHQTDSPKFEYQEFSKKIDDILTGLKRNEMGTEIVFDELQEMKEALKVLDKKNWMQLLKGKLVDLAFDKTAGLTATAAGAIFYDLTGYHLDKLLK